MYPMALGPLTVPPSLKGLNFAYKSAFFGHSAATQ